MISEFEGLLIFCFLTSFGLIWGKIDRIMKELKEVERMIIEIDCDKEIKKLKEEKEELIDKFVDKCQEINSKIKYLKRLKEEVE